MTVTMKQCQVRVPVVFPVLIPMMNFGDVMCHETYPKGMLSAYPGHYPRHWLLGPSYPPEHTCTARILTPDRSAGECRCRLFTLACTPTFENQSPAVGECSCSTIWRVGVSPTWTLCCHTVLAFCASEEHHPSGDKSNKWRLLPLIPCILQYNFERTDRTPQLNRTWLKRPQK